MLPHGALLFSRNGLTLALDTPEAIPISAKICILRGWCFATDRTSNFGLFLYVDGVRHDAYFGFSRPDVADFFTDAELFKCGFLIRLPRSHNTSVTLFGRLDCFEFPLIERIPISPASSSAGSEQPSYTDWLRLNEPELFGREDQLDKTLVLLARKPLVSIVVPTYNTFPYFLHRCIDSVLDQHYDNWQLCIGDDCSSDASVMAICREYANKDNRIQLAYSARQGGISNASNVALTNATGEFLIFLDHDDELHPFALLELVSAINEHPDCQLFYSDEDKIDIYGNRSNPAFKPDFDENIFLSFNYLGHMVALARSLVNQLGGFRTPCDGAQDWDLLVRAIEVIPASAIWHIRKPLYHWRMHESSTSVNLDAKPYVGRAWETVLQDHVNRTQDSAVVTNGLFYGSKRKRYMARVGIEVGVISRTEDGVHQSAIINLNGGARKLHLYHAAERALFELPAEGRATFSAAAHSSINSSRRAGWVYNLTDLRGDVLVFINGPLESINHLFLEELVAQCLREDCGVATGISLDCEHRVVASGLINTSSGQLLDPFVGIQYPSHGYMGQLSVVRTLDVCSDTFFATSRLHLSEVGGIDAICSSRPGLLSRALSENARRNGASVIFTPFAIATFSSRSEPRPNNCSEYDTLFALRRIRSDTFQSEEI